MGSAPAAGGELQASDMYVQVLASGETGDPGASYWIDQVPKASYRRDPC